MSTQTSLGQFLCCASAIRNVSGWVSAKEAFEAGTESTGKKAFEELFNSESEIPINNADIELAEKVIKFIDEMEPDNAYTMSLKGIFNEDSVTEKTANMAASMLELYRKEEIKKYNGPYVGRVGKKIIIQVELLLEQDIWTRFGQSRLYKFRSLTENSIIVWFNNGFLLKKKIGDEFLLSGMVKSHTVYKGINTTGMNRCKIFGE